MGMEVLLNVDTDHLNSGFTWFRGPSRGPYTSFCRTEDVLFTYICILLNVLRILYFLKVHIILDSFICSPPSIRECQDARL
jgi:hypothetical protein